MINLKNPIVRGSLVLLILTGFFNFLNFLYHILMARSLSIEDFGLLKRVFVFLYVGAVLLDSIQTIITKYSSTQASDLGKLKFILKKSMNKIGKLSILVFIIFLIIAIPLSFIFNLPYVLLVMTGVFLSGSMIVPITRGLLQGQQRFYALGFSVISEGIFKIVFALAFVGLGFKVYGAVGGVLISIILTLGVSFIYLKKVITSKEKPAQLEGIRNYSWPVLIVTATLILFFNMDVLLAGSFFSETSAGIYAIASTIAIIIFIGTQPINRVLFPITASNISQNKPSKNNFMKAFLLIGLCALAALLVIFIFPDFIINLVSGKSIPEAKSIILILSAGTSILSITSLILFYKLSQGKTRGYKIIPVFLLIEAILLLIFSSSLLSFAFAFLIANIIFLIGSLVLLNR